MAYPAPNRRNKPSTVAMPETVMDCGGKRSATPLWPEVERPNKDSLSRVRKRCRRSALPPHSMTPRGIRRVPACFNVPAAVGVFRSDRKPAIGQSTPTALNGRRIPNQLPHTFNNLICSSSFVGASPKGQRLRLRFSWLRALANRLSTVSPAKSLRRSAV